MDMEGWVERKNEALKVAKAEAKEHGDSETLRQQAETCGTSPVAVGYGSLLKRVVPSDTPRWPPWKEHRHRRRYTYRYSFRQNRQVVLD